MAFGTLLLLNIRIERGSVFVVFLFNNVMLTYKVRKKHFYLCLILSFLLGKTEYRHSKEVLG